VHNGKIVLARELLDGFQVFRICAVGDSELVTAKVATSLKRLAYDVLDDRCQLLGGGPPMKHDSNLDVLIGVSGAD
jgi:hypothetical protein